MDFSQLFTVHLAVGALTSGFLLLAAPYAFQFFIEAEPAKLPSSVLELFARYIWGTSSLLVGFAILPDGERTMAKILLITVFGGSVVAIRYISDYVQIRERRDRIAEKSKDLNG